MEVKSAYIHIPFCVRICTYCDFNKYFIYNQPVDEYLDCLIKEMCDSEVRVLETVFVGGGTPTALSYKQLKRLLIAITDTFEIKGEFSFEANPDELTLEKVQLLKDFGVNRLSMGVQTFKPELLEILGRTHHTTDIYRAVSNARAVGIPSISLDLMYHLPQQTLEDFKDSLEKALAMDIDHISSYGLILEPKTQFYNMYKKGKLKIPNEDIGEEMYEYLIERMNKSDLHQYEISNFGKVGHESEHNKVYWKNEGYYGFGAGASGYVNGERYSNVNPVNHYIKKIKNNERPILQSTYPTKTEQMEEEMFLGLRMNKGVSKNRFFEKFDQTVEQVYEKSLKDLTQKGLIVEKDDYISMTDRGKVVGNLVFESFLLNV
ncbi:radical SAM family heme chaperone HemW [Staphylococcus pseudoxylosus]|uniref:radical SAM family heme chaperone HemW n=1 Tax=Staphylococcus pseudoxylosus TaxID=2282419 RepID=UPI000D1D2E5D|nr:radical SAM family heme chaperone HemW [Staphylococcus pseudoxylosus]PTI45309.1 oxygen-independent coproporphyrinogen III oxidase [Staphylococcus xylosus]MDW8798614.1 radical SAM family heme chaperone HemW [Staphylococcus pseudoxylosus]MEB6035961.1 radical SAM family heme chaperone HemW [Staphylococcus pseudoxylosus]MEB6045254.1 radical SAM family heme chaperone HemW [Staphylococcus pseudoxylosus]MEB6059790.1 radical SAM family heme chaperone HemW [Staphylococcus pseudoxylosus]